MNCWCEEVFLAVDTTVKRKQGRPPKSPEEQAAIRSKIIGVAKELFINEGVDQVSVRKIAARVGCTPRTLYYYFENKRSLLHFIWVDIFSQLSDFAADHPENAEPINKIKLLLMAYAQYWLKHPDHFRVVFSIEELNSTPDQDEQANEIIMQSQYFTSLFNEIKKCCESQIFSESNHTLIGQVLLCGVQGIVSNLLTIKQMKWAPAEQLLELQINSILSGLKLNH